jgi:hypothetical protein
MADAQAVVTAPAQADVQEVPFEWKLETKHLEEHYDDKGSCSATRRGGDSDGSLGYQHIIEAGERPPKPDDEDKWQHFVLTYTRHFDRKSNYRHSTVQIKSKPLKDILKAVIPAYPGISFATDSVNLSLPSEVLLHYRKELYETLEMGEIGDEEGRKHLKFMLQWYEEEDAALIKEYTNLVDQGLTTYQL